MATILAPQFGREVLRCNQSSALRETFHTGKVTHDGTEMFSWCAFWAPSVAVDALKAVRTTDCAPRIGTSQRLFEGRSCC